MAVAPRGRANSDKYASACATTSGQSVCTARRDRRIPACWRWPPGWVRRSPTAAGRWCPAAETSRRWARWPPAPARAAATPSGSSRRRLVQRELADVDADELIVTDTMRQRKQIMEDRADAFITLPGGIGTLEELFETWTAGYLGMHDKTGGDAGPRRPLRRTARLAGRAGRHRLRLHRRPGPAAGRARHRAQPAICAHRPRSGCTAWLARMPETAHVCRPDRSRHPVAGRVAGRADDPARSEHRLAGPPDIQDIDRQGVSGPRREVTPTGRSSNSATEALTYAEANATANRYAAVLAERGVGRGDVVGVMLRNSPNAVLMMLAAVKCGAVAGHAQLPPARRRAGPQHRSAGRQGAGGRDRSRRAHHRQRRRTALRHRRPSRRSSSWPQTRADRQSGVGVARSRPRTPRSTSSPRAPPDIRKPA